MYTDVIVPIVLVLVLVLVLLLRPLRPEIGQETW